jgi:type IV pilus assembly protein PilA
MGGGTERQPGSGRPGEGQAGFTLVELMVVVLVIGILIAIALATYAGARDRAADRAVQSDLRTGLVTAMSHYVNTPNRSYDGFDVPTAKAAEPSLDWVSPGPPAEGQVDIQVASGDDLLLVGKSKSGTYFCLGQVWGSPLTIKGKGPAFSDVDTIADCDGGW